MPRFFYIVRDRTGKRLNGYEEALNLDELVARLQSRNFIVINVIPESKDIKVSVKGEESSRSAKHRHIGIHQSDLVLFCRQLATLLGAGVTILKSLEVILRQVASRRLSNIIKDIAKDMEAGLSLHEAMAKRPKVFSDLWVNLIESGEASGNLAVVLSRLAGYLERNADFKRKIISALIYPAILMTAGLGALLFLTIKIIPTFVEIFKGFNVALPFLTQVLVTISNFLKKFLFIILGVITGIVFIIRAFIRTRNGRWAFENFLFNFPLFGNFFHALVIERFSSEMSTLVESGVPILFSLEITERSVNNLIMANIIRQIKENVRDGKPLGQQLEKSGFFEPMIVQMVTVGEEIGELSQMFKRINTFYEEYVSTFLARFTTIFEPIMLIFMGAVIAIMVVGMFLPILQLSQIGY